MNVQWVWTHDGQRFAIGARPDGHTRHGHKPKIAIVPLRQVGSGVVVRVNRAGPAATDFKVIDPRDKNEVLAYHVAVSQLYICWEMQLIVDHSFHGVRLEVSPRTYNDNANFVECKKFLKMVMSMTKQMVERVQKGAK